MKNILSIAPRKIVQEAQPSLRKAENQLESVFGSKIQLEIDLNETFEYFPRGKEAPKKEQLTAEQKEKIARWITTSGITAFLDMSQNFKPLIILCLRTMVFSRQLNMTQKIPRKL